MYIDKEDINPNLYKVWPKKCAIANNYQGTGYTTMLNVSGKGWFLGAYQHVGDDDGMTGYAQIIIDGVTKIDGMVLFSTYEYGGVPRNLVLPIRFESSLVVNHKVGNANTGVGTTVIYDLD